MFALVSVFVCRSCSARTQKQLLFANRVASHCAVAAANDYNIIPILLSYISRWWLLGSPSGMNTLIARLLNLIHACADGRALCFRHTLIICVAVADALQALQNTLQSRRVLFVNNRHLRDIRRVDASRQRILYMNVTTNVCLWCVQMRIYMVKIPDYCCMW